MYHNEQKGVLARSKKYPKLSSNYILIVIMISAIHLAVMVELHLYLHMVNITKEEQEHSLSTIE
jgi:hypothetical protein